MDINWLAIITLVFGTLGPIICLFAASYASKDYHELFRIFLGLGLASGIVGFIMSINILNNEDERKNKGSLIAAIIGIAIPLLLALLLLLMIMYPQ